MVLLFLTFSGTFKLSSTVTISVYIPTSNTQIFLFSTSLPILVTIYLFDDSCSNSCEVISHWFLFNFCSIFVILSIFPVPFGHLYIFVGKMSIRFLIRLFFLYVGVVWVPSIYLDINFLSDMCFANIFSFYIFSFCWLFAVIPLFFFKIFLIWTLF